MSARRLGRGVRDPRPRRPTGASARRRRSMATSAPAR